MRTIVTKGKCVHTCKSEEQLQRFLKAGWKKTKKQPKANPEEGKADGAADNPEGSAEGEE